MLQLIYVLRPYQHRSIRRIRKGDFTVTLHFLGTYMSVWKIVARYERLLASYVHRLTHKQYCPEPKNDEEKELQKEEDETYIRGRIQYVPISS